MSKRKKINLNEWPTKSSLSCYDCCHPFDTIPIPMVHTQFDLDKRVFHVCVNDFANPFPVFCSLNCLLGYIAHSNLNQSKLNHNAKMLLLWQQIKYATPNFHLTIRSRDELSLFGGPRTIAEYRQGFCQFYNKSPVQSVQSSEVVRDVDYILWPVQMPHVRKETKETKETNSLSLVSLDDPTEVVPYHEKQPKDKNEKQSNTLGSSTVDFISNILHETLNTKQVTDLTAQMKHMSFPSDPPPPAKKQKTATTTCPKPTPSLAQKAIPPAAMKPPARTSHSTVNHHPMFQRIATTDSSTITWK